MTAAMNDNTSKHPSAVPGWYQAGLGHVWLPYAQMKTMRPPLAVARTQGCRIVLADGRELIDGIASWWTACHGYNHPHIRAAVERQLAAMPHVMFGGLVHEQALTLARRLVALLPGDLERVFFCESGSVAVEIAMKMAVQYWRNRGVRGRNKFVAFKGGYHGDTTGAMALCDPEVGMHAMFQGLLPEHFLLDLPRDETSAAALEKFLQRHAEQIAGIVVEPLVQGAGGMHFHDADILRRLRQAADRYELLLIFDEIFTGFGRTGNMFACDAAGVIPTALSNDRRPPISGLPEIGISMRKSAKADLRWLASLAPQGDGESESFSEAVGITPDIITLSKALTGGTLPLAATIARRSVFEAFWSDDPKHALMHGPTYMGNALACAAANASLDLFESEPRLAQVAAISRQMSQELAPCRDLPGVKDVRVMGAIGVVELDRIDDLEGLRARFITEGVFIRPFGKVVYLTPAFTIAAEDLARLTTAMVKVLGEGA